MRSKAGGQASGSKGKDFDDSDRFRATRPDAGSDSEDEIESDDEDLERAGEDDEGVFDQDADSDEDGDQDGEGGQDKEKLARTKLTQKDYARRAHSATARKKGKYGVTVPRPFSGMMDKPKAKTIA